MNKNYIYTPNLRYESHPLITRTSQSPSQRQEYRRSTLLQKPKDPQTSYTSLRKKRKASVLSYNEVDPSVRRKDSHTSDTSYPFRTFTRKVKKANGTLKVPSLPECNMIPSVTEDLTVRGTSLLTSTSTNTRREVRRERVVSPKLSLPSYSLLPKAKGDGVLRRYSALLKKDLSPYAKLSEKRTATNEDIKGTALLSNENSLLFRFSCSLLGNGKRVSGHKILLQSLFLLRQNYGPSIFFKKNSEKSKAFGTRSLPTVYPSVEESKASYLPKDVASRFAGGDQVQHQKEKNIRQFKILPFCLLKYTKQMKSYTSLLPSNFLRKTNTRFDVREQEIKMASPSSFDKGAHTSIREATSLAGVDSLSTYKSNKVGTGKKISSGRLWDSICERKKKTTSALDYFFTRHNNKKLAKGVNNTENDALCKSYANFARGENEEVKNKKFRFFRYALEKSINKPEHQLFTSESALSKSLCIDCVESVKPILETRKVRKGRVTYKVPKISSLQRQKGKAITILKQNAASRKKGDLKNLKTYYSGSLLPEIKTNLLLSTQSTEGDLSLFKGKVASKSSQPHIILRESFIKSDGEKTNVNLQKNEISFLSLSPRSFDRPPNIVEKQYTIDSTSNKSMKDKPISKVKGEIKKKNLALESFTSMQKSEENLLFSNNIFLNGSERRYFLYSLRKPVLKDCLSEEFFESGNERGESIEKKKQLHLLALQNRAYLHFRWW